MEEEFTAEKFQSKTISRKKQCLYTSSKRIFMLVEYEPEITHNNFGCFQSFL